MKRPFLVILLIIISLIAIATGWRRAYILRSADAVDLRVETRDTDTLLISGGMTHSGLTVVRSTTQSIDDRVIIRVYIVPAAPSGGQGTYRIVVRAPQAVREIWFGDRPDQRTVGTLFGFPIRIPTRSQTGAAIWHR